jgi:N utilization substance protein B
MKKSGFSETGLREIGRIITLFALYIYDISEVDLCYLKKISWYEGILEFGDEDGLLPPIQKNYKAHIEDFFVELLMGVVSNLEKVDGEIKINLVNWNFDRLHPIDKAILRMSVYSLIYRFDIPPEVTIFQANEMAEDYSDDKSYKYINGILHSVKEKFRRNFLLDTGSVSKKKHVKKIRIIKGVKKR